MQEKTYQVPTVEICFELDSEASLSTLSVPSTTVKPIQERKVGQQSCYSPKPRYMPTQQVEPNLVADRKDCEAGEMASLEDEAMYCEADAEELRIQEALEI